MLTDSDHIEGLRRGEKSLRIPFCEPLEVACTLVASCAAPSRRKSVKEQWHVPWVPPEGCSPENREVCRCVWSTDALFGTYSGNGAQMRLFHLTLLHIPRPHDSLRHSCPLLLGILLPRIVLEGMRASDCSLRTSVQRQRSSKRCCGAFPTRSFSL